MCEDIQLTFKSDILCKTCKWARKSHANKYQTTHARTSHGRLAGIQSNNKGGGGGGEGQ